MILNRLMIIWKKIIYSHWILENKVWSIHRQTLQKQENHFQKKVFVQMITSHYRRLQISYLSADQQSFKIWNILRVSFERDICTCFLIQIRDCFLKAGKLTKEIYWLIWSNLKTVSLRQSRFFNIWHSVFLKI